MALQDNIPGVDSNAIQVTTFGIYGYEKGGHHARAHNDNVQHAAHREAEHHH